MHPDSQIKCPICGEYQRIDDDCDCGACEECGEKCKKLADGLCEECWQHHWDIKNYRFL